MNWEVFVFRLTRLSTTGPETLGPVDGSLSGRVTDWVLQKLTWNLGCKLSLGISSCEKGGGTRQRKQWSDAVGLRSLGQPGGTLMGSAPIKVALKVKMAASSCPCFARLLNMDCPRKGVPEGGEALSSRVRTEILTMEEVCWLSSLQKRASPSSFLEGPSSQHIPVSASRWWTMGRTFALETDKSTERKSPSFFLGMVVRGYMGGTIVSSWDLNYLSTQPLLLIRFQGRKRWS